jgi:hypothetical protein
MGRIVHYAIDLVLISMVLAGVRRATGLQLLYSHSDLKKYIARYLSFGEMMFDKFTSVCEMSGWFGRPGISDRDLRE